MLHIIFILCLKASWQKVFFCQCQKEKSRDAFEYGEVEMVEKYLWGEGMWYITGLTGSTKKSLIYKFFPAATEFGQLVEKAALWQPVCINVSIDIW